MPVTKERGRRRADPPSGEASAIRAGKDSANINVWVDAALVRVLDQFVASYQPRPSKTSVVEAALIAFFEAKGYWPPKAPE